VLREPVAGDAERVVTAAIAAAWRRARLLAIAEAIAWGLVAAAMQTAGAIVVALAIGIWRWRGLSHAAVVRELERAQPDSRNLFVTADELSREVLTASSAVRARVFADAAVRARNIDVRAAFPLMPLMRAVAIAVAAWGAVLAVSSWRHRQTGTAPGTAA
jgi:hypothetical protein